MNKDINIDMSSSLSKLINNVSCEKKNSNKIQTLYCSNCGKSGHIYKKCKDPITSIGIIVLNISNINILDSLFKKIEYKYIYKNLINKYQNTKYIFKKIYLSNFNNKNLLQNDINNESFEINKNIIKNNIKFLLIQRKFSVGYIEFLRGRYDEYDHENLNFIINQMTPIEVKDIEYKDFDYLWNNLWNNKYNDIPLNINKIEELDNYNLTYSEKKIYINTAIKIENIGKDNKVLFFVVPNDLNL